MASFVHIADARDVRRIEKNGLKAGKRGVFCSPVTKNFSVTHQWARELRRNPVKAWSCIQFRIPDNELVLVGKYNGDKISLTAAESAATVMNHTSPEGLEVVIGRKIRPKEITRIYSAPRITGWRYYPEAKGKKPFCHCRYCNRGEIKAKRLIIDD